MSFSRWSCQLQTSCEHAVDDELTVFQIEPQERSSSFHGFEGAPGKRSDKPPGLREEQSDHNGLPDGHLDDPPSRYARGEYFDDILEVRQLRHSGS